MTVELFVTPPPVAIYTKCDCRKVTRKKVVVPAPESNQPMVTLQRSIDSRWYVGTCTCCGKIHTKENK